MIISKCFFSMQVVINPEFKVAEMSFDNNAVVCTLYYGHQYASLFNCSLQRPWSTSWASRNNILWTINFEFFSVSHTATFSLRKDRKRETTRRRVAKNYTLFYVTLFCVYLISKSICLCSPFLSIPFPFCLLFFFSFWRKKRWLG